MPIGRDVLPDPTSSTHIEGLILTLDRRLLSMISDPTSSSGHADVTCWLDVSIFRDILIINKRKTNLRAHQ